MSVTVEVRGLRQLVIKLDATAAALVGGGRVVVGTNVQYARMVSEGTRAHRIEARNAKALFWPGAAHPVRSVRHPGTKPNPYVEEAVAASGPQVAAIIGAAVAVITEPGVGSLQPALLASGMAVQANIQRGAPVKTGNLRSSWHTEAM